MTLSSVEWVRALRYALIGISGKKFLLKLICNLYDVVALGARIIVKHNLSMKLSYIHGKAQETMFLIGDLKILNFPLLAKLL